MLLLLLIDTKNNAYQFLLPIRIGFLNLLALPKTKWAKSGNKLFKHPTKMFAWQLTTNAYPIYVYLHRLKERLQHYFRNQHKSVRISYLKLIDV